MQKYLSQHKHFSLLDTVSNVPSFGSKPSDLKFVEDTDRKWEVTRSNHNIPSFLINAKDAASDR